MVSDAVRVAEGLWAWARGLYPLEAAVLLLVHHGYWLARPDIVTVEDDGRVWIDFEELAARFDGGYFTTTSGGERRVLAVALSLAGARPVDLGEALPGLGREHLALVLAAASHAGGAHEHRDVAGLREAAAGAPLTRGVLTGGAVLGPLVPWPGDGL